MGSWNERKALTAIIIFASLLRIALAFRSEQLIFSKYYQEDAYYLFTTAQHLAHGEGFSADGIHPTNGVQPLIVVFYAPLFLLSHFDKLLALQLGFIYTALFDGLSMIFLYLLLKILRKENTGEEGSVWMRPQIIAPLLYGTLFPVFVHTVSGLETGLYSMLLLASLYFYAKILKERNHGPISAWRYIGLGALLGLTVLARIDAIIFVDLIGIYEIYKQKAKGIQNTAIIGICSFAISLPWWYYNYQTFGSLMPQSGISERLGIDLSRNGWQMISTIADCASVFFSLTKMVDIPVIFYASWFIIIIGGVFFLAKKWKLASYIKKLYSIEALIPLFWTSAFFAIYYTFFFAAPHFIPRYMQPLRIGMIIIVAMVLPLIVREMLRSQAKKILLSLFIVAATSNTFLRYPPNFLIKNYSTFYQVGKWALTIPHAKIGMYQSGASGFVAANIVNLDGKVNYDALRARLDGGIGAYIASANLDYIADQKSQAQEIVQSAEKFGAHFELADSIKEVLIYKRIR